MGPDSASQAAAAFTRSAASAVLRNPICPAALRISEPSSLIGDNRDTVTSRMVDRPSVMVGMIRAIAPNASNTGPNAAKKAAVPRITDCSRGSMSANPFATRLMKPESLSSTAVMLTFLSMASPKTPKDCLIDD